MNTPNFTALGGGPTVVLLHGIGGGHLAFAPQVETLASNGYRAVAWDMPGYGHSAPIEPYTFKGLAQSCIQLIETLKCDNVALVALWAIRNTSHTRRRAQAACPAARLLWFPRCMSESRSARASPKIHQQSNADIGANVASGSYPADAMIVLPCSVGTLARIAHGDASHLIERAADVCLKEKRPLVLCVRETPLNKIHIRNMYRAADAGATIFPLIPAFYYRPATLDALAREFAYRLLSHVGLPQAAAFRWKG